MYVSEFLRWRKMELDNSSEVPLGRPSVFAHNDHGPILPAPEYGRHGIAYASSEDCMQVGRRAGKDLVDEARKHTGCRTTFAPRRDIRDARQIIGAPSKNRLLA